MKESEAIVVPVIDVANFPAELEKLAAAITGLGCFRVINHGIPLSLLANMKETTRSLFDIPREAKLRNVTGDFVDGGYVPPNYAPNIPFYESFGIYNAASPTDVHSFCSLLDVSPLQREIIVDYLGKLHILITDLASRVAESLGLIDIGNYSFKEWRCHARLNSYEFKFEEDIGCIGVPAHTDSGFLTVLQEDECVDGLEIVDANGNFISVDPLPGTLFVNIGDVGKVWSNGRLENVKHRVICKKAEPRISIVLFLVAPKDDKIVPQPALIDIDHPKLYESYIYNEYRMQRRITGLRAGENLPLLNADRSSTNDALVDSNII